MKHFSRGEEEEEGVVMVVIVLLLLLLLLLLVVLLLPRPHTAAIRGAGMLDAPPRCRVGASRGARRNGEGGAEKAHGVGDEAPGTNTGGAGDSRRGRTRWQARLATSVGRVQLYL